MSAPSFVSLKDKVDADLLEDPQDVESWSSASSRTAAGAVPTPVSDTSPNARAARKRAADQFKRGRNPFNPRNQPRDYRGQFRRVLARLKVNLGESELNQVVDKVEDAEKLEKAGDYGKSADAATDVVQMIDRLEEGALDPNQLQNVKNAARELGRAIAYLPLPQGDPNDKLNFSDLPPTTQQLLDNMEKRILDKLEPEKAAKLLDTIHAFTSGQVRLSSDELQAELSRLLKYLID